MNSKNKQPIGYEWCRFKVILSSCDRMDEVPAYLKSLEDPSIPLTSREHCFNKVDKDGNNGTDDVSCISWIQTKKA